MPNLVFMDYILILGANFAFVIKFAKILQQIVMGKTNKLFLICITQYALRLASWKKKKALLVQKKGNAKN